MRFEQIALRFALKRLNIRRILREQSYPKTVLWSSGDYTVEFLQVLEKSR